MCGQGDLLLHTVFGGNVQQETGLLPVKFPVFLMQVLVMSLKLRNNTAILTNLLLYAGPREVKVP